MLLEHQRKRLISKREVSRRNSYSERSIHRRVADDNFPKPVPLPGEVRAAFVEQEIDDWIDEQIARNRGTPASPAAAGNSAAAEAAEATSSAGHAIVIARGGAIATARTPSD